MKISSTLFLASIGPVSAYVAPSAMRRCLPLRMSDPRQEMDVKNLAPNQNKNVQPQMSKSLPFLTCPAVLDGSMAGDVGFDPLGLSKDQKDLNFYREAEIKHARLAMLAAAGWPVSELFDKKIAFLLGMTPVLDAANRVPSVLNGGMGKISPFYWAGCVVLAAAVDVYGLSQAPKKEGYFAGNLGFDPFGLNPKDETGRKRMQLAEIKNGRLAMIAITAFAAQEFVSHVAVIDQTPFFFKPIWETLSDLSESNSGYYMPPVETPALLDAVTAPIDAAVTNSAEAATAVTSSVDAVSAAAVEATSAVSPPVDAVSTAAAEAASAVSPPVDAVSNGAVSPPVDDAELVAAKKRIAELEAKLNSIGALTR